MGLLEEYRRTLHPQESPTKNKYIPKEDIRPEDLRRIKRDTRSQQESATELDKLATEFDSVMGGYEQQLQQPPESTVDERSILGDVAVSTTRGGLQAANLFGNALDTMGLDMGEDLADWSKDVQQNASWLRPERDAAAGREGTLEKGVKDTLQAVPSSLGYPGGGAAIGAGVGSLIAPGPGTAIGAWGGGLIGTFIGFGLGTFGQQKKEFEKYNPEASEEDANGYALKQAGIEFGGEMVSNVIAAISFGAGKVVKQPLKMSIKQLLTTPKKTLAKNIITNATKNEIPTEVFQSAVGTALRTKEGMAPEDAWKQAAVDSILPAAGLSMLFGLGMHTIAEPIQRKRVEKGLNSDDSKVRQKAAGIVRKGIAEKDPSLAKMWEELATERIRNEKPIDIKQNFRQFADQKMQQEESELTAKQMEGEKEKELAARILKAYDEGDTESATEEVRDWVRPFTDKQEDIEEVNNERLAELIDERNKELKEGDIEPAEEWDQVKDRLQKEEKKPYEPMEEEVRGNADALRETILNTEDGDLFTDRGNIKGTAVKHLSKGRINEKGKREDVTSKNAPGFLKEGAENAKEMRDRAEDEEETQKWQDELDRYNDALEKIGKERIGEEAQKIEEKGKAEPNELEERRKRENYDSDEDYVIGYNYATAQKYGVGKQAEYKEMEGGEVKSVRKTLTAKDKSDYKYRYDQTQKQKSEAEEAKAEQQPAAAPQAGEETKSPQGEQELREKGRARANRELSKLQNAQKTESERGDSPEVREDRQRKIDEAEKEIEMIDRGDPIAEDGRPLSIYSQRGERSADAKADPNKVDDKARNIKKNIGEKAGQAFRDGYEQRRDELVRERMREKEAPKKPKKTPKKPEKPSIAEMGDQEMRDELAESFGYMENSKGVPVERMNRNGLKRALRIQRDRVEKARQETQEGPKPAKTVTNSKLKEGTDKGGIQYREARIIGHDGVQILDAKGNVVKSIYQKDAVNEAKEKLAKYEESESEPKTQKLPREMTDKQIIKELKDEYDYVENSGGKPTDKMTRRGLIMALYGQRRKGKKAEPKEAEEVSEPQAEEVEEEAEGETPMPEGDLDEILNKVQQEIDKEEGTEERGFGSGVKEIAKGMNAALTAVTKGVAQPGRAKVGFSFDEDTYQDVKPHLREAYDHFIQAYEDFKTGYKNFVKWVKRYFGDRLDVNTYLRRFNKDLQEEAKKGSKTKGFQSVEEFKALDEFDQFRRVDELTTEQKRAFNKELMDTGEMHGWLSRKRAAKQAGKLTIGTVTIHHQGEDKELSREQVAKYEPGEQIIYQPEDVNPVEGETQERHSPTQIIEAIDRNEKKANDAWEKGKSWPRMHNPVGRAYQIVGTREEDGRTVTYLRDLSAVGEGKAAPKRREKPDTISQDEWNGMNENQQEMTVELEWKKSGKFVRYEGDVNDLRRDATYRTANALKEQYQAVENVRTALFNGEEVSDEDLEIIATQYGTPYAEALQKYAGKVARGEFGEIVYAKPGESFDRKKNDAVEVDVAKYYEDKYGTSLKKNDVLQILKDAGLERDAEGRLLKGKKKDVLIDTYLEAYYNKQLVDVFDEGEAKEAWYPWRWRRPKVLDLQMREIEKLNALRRVPTERQMGREKPERLESVKKLKETYPGDHNLQNFTDRAHEALNQQGRSGISQMTPSKEIPDIALDNKSGDRDKNRRIIDNLRLLSVAPGELYTDSEGNTKVMDDETQKAVAEQAIKDLDLGREKEPLQVIKGYAKDVEALRNAAEKLLDKPASEPKRNKLIQTGRRYAKNVIKVAEKNFDDSSRKQKNGKRIYNKPLTEPEKILVRAIARGRGVTDFTTVKEDSRRYKMLINRLLEQYFKENKTNKERNREIGTIAKNARNTVVNREQLTRLRGGSMNAYDRSIGGVGSIEDIIYDMLSPQGKAMIGVESMKRKWARHLIKKLEERKEGETTFSMDDIEKVLVDAGYAHKDNSRAYSSMIGVIDDILGGRPVKLSMDKSMIDEEGEAFDMHSYLTGDEATHGFRSFRFIGVNAFPGGEYHSFDNLVKNHVKPVADSFERDNKTLFADLDRFKNKFGEYGARLLVSKISGLQAIDKESAEYYEEVRKIEDILDTSRLRETAHEWGRGATTGAFATFQKEMGFKINRTRVKNHMEGKENKYAAADYSIIKQMSEELFAKGAVKDGTKNRYKTTIGRHQADWVLTVVNYGLQDLETVDAKIAFVESLTPAAADNLRPFAEWMQHRTDVVYKIGDTIVPPEALNKEQKAAMRQKVDSTRVAWENDYNVVDSMLSYYAGQMAWEKLSGELGRRARTLGEAEEVPVESAEVKEKPMEEIRKEREQRILEHDAQKSKVKETKEQRGYSSDEIAEMDNKTIKKKLKTYGVKASTVDNASTAKLQQMMKHFSASGLFVWGLGPMGRTVNTRVVENAKKKDLVEIKARLRLHGKQYEKRTSETLNKLKTEYGKQTVRELKSSILIEIGEQSGGIGLESTKNFDDKAGARREATDRAKVDPQWRGLNHLSSRVRGVRTAGQERAQRDITQEIVNDALSEYPELGKDKTISLNELSKRIEKAKAKIVNSYEEEARQELEADPLKERYQSTILGKTISLEKANLQMEYLVDGAGGNWTRVSLDNTASPGDLLGFGRINDVDVELRAWRNGEAGGKTEFYDDHIVIYFDMDRGNNTTVGHETGHIAWRTLKASDRKVLARALGLKGVALEEEAMSKIDKAVAGNWRIGSQNSRLRAAWDAFKEILGRIAHWDAKGAYKAYKNGLMSYRTEQANRVLGNLQEYKQGFLKGLTQKHLKEAVGKNYFQTISPNATSKQAATDAIDTTLEDVKPAKELYGAKNKAWSGLRDVATMIQDPALMIYRIGGDKLRNMWIQTETTADEKVGAVEKAAKEAYGKFDTKSKHLKANKMEHFDSKGRMWNAKLHRTVKRPGGSQSIDIKKSEKLTAVLFHRMAEEAHEKDDDPRLRIAMNRITTRAMMKNARGGNPRHIDMTQSDWKMIEDSLTKQEEEILEAGKEYYDVLYEHLNKEYKEQNDDENLPYWTWYTHITRDRAFNKNAQGDWGTGQKQALGDYIDVIEDFDPQTMSEIQARGISTDPVVLGDYFSEVKLYHNKVIKYIETAGPQRWIRENILNNKEVSDKITEKLGSEFVTSFNARVKAMGGILDVRKQNAFNKNLNLLLRNATTARLLTATVALKQPMSVFNTLPEFGNKHFAAGMKWMFHANKKKVDAVAEANASIYRRLHLGATFQPHQENVAGAALGGPNKGAIRRMQRVSEIGVEKLLKVGDRRAIHAIIGMAASEVKADGKFKEGSQAFYNAVGRRAAEVVKRTQVSTTAMDRSMLAADNSLINKGFAYMFGAREKIVNRVMEASITLSRDWNKGGKARANAVRFATKSAIGVLGLQATGVAMVDLLRDMLSRPEDFDDDDEKTRAQKVTMQAFANLIDTEIGVLPGSNLLGMQSMGAALSPFHDEKTKELYVKWQGAHPAWSMLKSPPKAANALRRGLKAYQDSNDMTLNHKARKSAERKAKKQLDYALRESVRCGSEVLGIPASQLRNHYKLIAKESREK